MLKNNEKQLYFLVQRSVARRVIWFQSSLKSGIDLHFGKLL